ncbi:MAG: DUF5667 domain-containing protein [Actinomycetes bacterium]
MSRRSEADRVEELARLLDGEIEAAGATAGVRSLLLLAETVREETVLERPSEEFRASLRDRILAEAATFPVVAPAVERSPSVRERLDGSVGRLRSSARVAVATATASGLIGAAGVAAAAQAALPGDVLYGVKQATEQLRVAMAEDGVEAGRVRLQLAHERLTELEEGRDRLAAGDAVALLDRMDDHSHAGAESLLDAIARTGDEEVAALLREFAENQRTRLSVLRDELAIEVRPRADASLELLRRIDVQLGAATVLECDCAEGTTTSATGPGAATTVVAPGQGPAVTAGDCGCIEVGAATATPRDPGTRATDPTSTSDGASGDDGPAPAPTAPTTPTTPTGPTTSPDAPDGLVPGPIDTSSGTDPLEPVHELTEQLDQLRRNGGAGGAGDLLP